MEAAEEEVQFLQKIAYERNRFLDALKEEAVPHWESEVRSSFTKFVTFEKCHMWKWRKKWRHSKKWLYNEFDWDPSIAPQRSPGNQLFLPWGVSWCKQLLLRWVQQWCIQELIVISFIIGSFHVEWSKIGGRPPVDHLRFEWNLAHSITEPSN